MWKEAKEKNYLNYSNTTQTIPQRHNFFSNNQPTNQRKSLLWEKEGFWIPLWYFESLKLFHLKSIPHPQLETISNSSSL